MALNKFFGEAIYIYFKTFKELFNSSLIWELQFDISIIYRLFNFQLYNVMCFFIFEIRSNETIDKLKIPQSFFDFRYGPIVTNHQHE